jgi:hypothetical protein
MHLKAQRKDHEICGWNPGPSRYKHVVGLNLFMDPNPSSLEYWISNRNADYIHIIKTNF